MAAPAATQVCASGRQVRRGGLIAVDNTLFYGRLADPEVQDKQTQALRHFNAHVLAGAPRRRAHAACPGPCAAHAGTGTKASLLRAQMTG